MKYDIKPYDSEEKMKGFYIWNKPTFFVKKDDERLKCGKQIDEDNKDEVCEFYKER